MKGAQSFINSGASNTAGAVGSSIGAAVGTPLLGPVGGAAGAMLGGVVGNMVGATWGGLTGNNDVDVQVAQGGASGPFEGGLKFTTAFGDIGLNAKGTRNINNKGVAATLAPMQQYFTALDSQLAQNLSPSELAAVKSDLDGFQVSNATANQYGRDPVKALLKKRMETLRDSLTPERLKETGLDQVLAQYNAANAGPTPEQAQELRTAVSDYRQIKNEMSSEDPSAWNYRLLDDQTSQAQDRVKALSQQYLGKDITNDKGQDYTWDDQKWNNIDQIIANARKDMQFYQV